MSYYDTLFIVPADVYKAMQEKAKCVEVNNVINNAPPSQSSSNLLDQFRGQQRSYRKQEEIKKSGGGGGGVSLYRDGGHRRSFLEPIQSNLPPSQQDRLHGRSSNVDEQRRQVNEVDDTDVEQIIEQEDHDVEMISDDEERERIVEQKKEGRKAILKKALRQQEDIEMKDIIADRLDTLQGNKKKKDKKEIKEKDDERAARKEKYKILHTKLLHEARTTSPYYSKNMRKRGRKLTWQTKTPSPLDPITVVNKRKRWEGEGAVEGESVGRIKRVQKRHPFVIKSLEKSKRKQINDNEVDKEEERLNWHGGPFIDEQDTVSRPKIRDTRYASVRKVSKYAGHKRPGEKFDDEIEEQLTTNLPFKRSGVTYREQEEVRPEEQALPLDYFDDDDETMI